MTKTEGKTTSGLAGATTKQKQETMGKLLEYEKKDGKVVKSRRGKWLRHPFSGVGLGFKRGMPEEVLHMIAMHAKEGNLSPRMPAGVLVHHADFMNFEPFKK